MRGKSKQIVNISIMAILLTIIATVLSTIFVKTVDKTKTQLTSEHLRAMSYAELTEEDNKVENSEYVKFSAFFTRDLDGDGNAEKLKGTCKEINNTDTLFMDLNVLSEGYLKNGKITITGNNFNLSMSMIKDTVLKYNYISDDVTVIELNNVQAGTQKLILGKVIADIGNDITNYSKESFITLTGIHVSEDGLVETEINKTIDLTVDWYGDISASLYTHNSSYYYDDLTENTVSFGFYVKENQKELLLKDSIATSVIPDLNGYAPISVVCQDTSITAEYNEETRTLTMKRSSKIDENGIITSSLSRSNTYRVDVTYPEEAFKNITSYTKLTVPVTGMYVGYNNENDEFESPIGSNIATGTVSIIFTETPPETGYIYNFDIIFANKKYVSKPSRRYVISKQDLLNLYDNEGYAANFEYTVNWYAKRGVLGEVNSFIMSETKTSDEESYGDKFGQTIIEEYTLNKGIYFTYALETLGEEGTITVYNNDTNEVIKTFTKEEFEIYNSTNPYKYSESIKHIRVETSKANANNTLVVHNVKELNSKKIVQDFTKDEIKDVSMVYTYLTGVADIEGTGKETITDYDYAYYVSETSYANIGLEKNKLSTQETVNEKIYVSTEITQIGDANWKNGEFLVEVPEEIVNMEINSVIVDNSDVKIIAYDLYKKDGKYFIKLITKNEIPTTFKITIDTNITPDPRISTTSKTFKLYAYNEYCNDYYYTTKDTYDVDSDNNIEESVGTASTNLELLSPTSLITLQTVSEYNEEKEITIAPNVALVEREARQAKINISLTNNYPNTVSGVKILGKIPFEGNTYIINGKDLKSEFSTTMTSNGITNSEFNPEAVKEKTVIYYSENEDPTKDLTDSINGWKLLGDVKDFSKIKTYLIDLKDNEIEVGKEIKFEYDINLPENISYNKASFSNHAVYYELNTEGGKLQLSTEPNKVGVRIVNKFDFELTKYKANSNLIISGVTYTLKYKEPTPEGILEDKTRILTTNSEGKIVLEDLLAETDYVLQEIKVPNTCELNSEEISFKINEDLSVTFNGTVRNYEFTTGETLKIEVENEVKYNIEINKTKVGTDIKVSNVRFLLEDEEGNKKSVRTENGICTLIGLSVNKVYTLTETVVPGNCELNEGIFKFKIVRNNNVIELVTLENSLVSGTPVIQDLETEIIPVLKLNVENEIKYTLNLTKQDLDGNKIGGAIFTIKGKGLNGEGTNYTTSKDGKISISGLYVGEIYTVEETKAIGYYLDSQKENIIQFRVDRNNGSLQITTWIVGDGILQSGTQLISEKDLTAEINVTLENEKIPTYNLKIAKQNDEGLVLPGAQFKLTSKDTGAEEIITIDENGEGIFEGLYEYIEGKCVTGEYTLEEIYAPEGYVTNKNILKFKGSKNAEGNVEITILEGNELIKLDETTNIPVISSNETEAIFTIVNEPVFSLKKIGDNNRLLPNAKFILTDLDGNQITDTKGEVVGTEETINGITYKVVTTNENGEIKVDLPEGLYKVVEIQAPERYNLAENEKDRTYYFGVGASSPVKTSGVIDSIEWARTVKSKATSEFTDAVATDDGGVIAVGRAKVNIDTDGDDISDGIDQGNIDSIIIKYDSDGNIEWSKVLGGIRDDETFGIEKVPTGGYVVVGYSSTSDVYYGGTLIDVANYGNEDGIIVKIDENGNYLWSQSIGGTGLDKINDVAINENGDIAVVGSYYSSPLYMDKDKTESLTNRGNKDGFISVYTSNGTYSWSQNIGGTSDVYAQSVTATSTGFAVGANFLGTVYVDTAGTTSVATKGEADGILIGYTVDGVYSFSKQIGGTSNDIISEVILADDNETEGQKDIIVVGSYASSIDIDEDGTNDLTTKGNNDGMVVKFTEGGDYIKSLSIGGGSDDTISTITQTQDGGLLFGGWTYSSTVDLDKDGTNDIKSLSGVNDALIAKLDANDELEWFDSIKGTSYEQVTKVVQAKDGNFIALGDNQSPTLTAMGKSGIFATSKFADAFIIKYAETEITPEILEMQEICVINDLIKYKITTEIGINSENARTGGTITGLEYLSEDNIKFVENVKYEYANAQAIEIKPDENYYISKILINNEEIEFKTNENGEVILDAGYFEKVTEDKHIVVIFGSEANALTIKKQDEQGNNLAGATFELRKSNKLVDTVTTNEEGFVKVDLGSGNYTIKETVAPKGYVLSNQKTTVEITDELNQTITLTNKKAAEIIINKKDEETKESISGAKFAIYNTTSTYEIIDFAKDSNGQYIGEKNEDGIYEISTDENGQVSFLVAEGYYKVIETQAPDGYILSSEPQEIQVTNSELKELIFTNKKAQNNVILTKIDEETNEPIANTKFAIYSISSSDKISGFAKEVNGKYVGTKDENGIYKVSTDENGQIKLALPSGKYKIVEVEAAEGYLIGENDASKATYISVEDEKIEEIQIEETENNVETEVVTPDYTINYIEDLVDLATRVNSGESFEGKTVVLAKTLDFNDETSYENANDTTTYADYNGDGTTESIKLELTNTAGKGFLPIGQNPGVPFRGTFDGKGFEIKNIYINNSMYSGGLFGVISNAKILNVSVTGSIGYSTYGMGAIAGVAENSVISNCYNKATISSTGPYAGGIVGYSSNLTIENCYNEGKVNSSSMAGGIIGYSNNLTIEDCYNEGEVNSSTAGGIIGQANNSRITNCNNKAIITGTGNNSGYSTTAGIIGYVENSKIKDCSNEGTINGGAGIVGYGVTNEIIGCANEGTINSTFRTAGGIVGSYIQNSTIKDCYNTGNVTVNSQSAGGIVGNDVIDSTISNCYNTGAISNNSTSSSTSVGGITGYNVTNSTIENCYNTGSISNTNAISGGIATTITNTNIKECYNTGTITGTNGIAGIAVNSNDSVINGCYNKGTITSTNTSAGGIVYSASNTIISNCYNTGTVTNYCPAGIANSISNNSVLKNCYNTGNIVAASSPAGGLVWSVTNSEIANCYNTGIVESAISMNYVIGYNISNSTVSRVYYLDTSAPQLGGGLSDTVRTI